MSENPGLYKILDQMLHQDNFVIAGHVSPDGDTIGSCFSVAMALESLGKRVSVVLEPYLDRFSCIPGRKFLHMGSIDQLSPHVFIAMDCADAERLGEAEAIFRRAKVTCCIDHHETNPGFAHLNYIDPYAAATSEMCLTLIEQFMHPTRDIASAIYAGLVCDTGGFRYNATGKSTMETAARLMELDIPFTEIYSQLMHMHSFAAGKALGVAIANSNLCMDGKIIYSYVSRAALHAVGADYPDLDGAVEYLMSTSGTLATVLVYEGAKGIKVSMRSDGPNMGRVAVALGGGGHQLAAGATRRGELMEVLDVAIALVRKEVLAYAK